MSVSGYKVLPEPMVRCLEFYGMEKPNGRWQDEKCKRCW